MRCNNRSLSKSSKIAGRVQPGYDKHRPHFLLDLSIVPFSKKRACGKDAASLGLPQNGSAEALQRAKKLANSQRIRALVSSFAKNDCTGCGSQQNRATSKHHQVKTSAADDLRRKQGKNDQVYRRLFHWLERLRRG